MSDQPHSQASATPGAATPGARALETPALGVCAESLRVNGPDGVIVHSVDFDVTPGRTLAVIGESGSGKSMTARAITGLLPRGVTATGFSTIDGHTTDLSSNSEKVWSQVRGQRAVLLLQDPFTSLSPVLRCGKQIGETVQARRHTLGEKPLAQADLDAEVVKRLAEVRLPATVARNYPAELSGGMRQRVAIASALAAEPRLLIADEPTTALDASTQGEVLDLLKELQIRHDMCLMLISHDLGVVAGRADEVLVMRSGQVVERGLAVDVLQNPQHPYTQALIDANPAFSDTTLPEPVRDAAPVLEATGVSKWFGEQLALSDASVSVAAGELVAIVGESGSGKSTFARCIAGLEVPDGGSVVLAGKTLSAGRKGRTPGEMQIVFQDPYSTLNPSFTVAQSLTEALQASGNRAQTVEGLLKLVELDPALANRRPSQLSGGQRQRISIARALAPEPKLLICDESVSALDVSVQAQVLDLLNRLREDLNLAILFITHDLGVVARIAGRVIVLRSGEIVERGTTEEVLRRPTHEYTKLLVAAAQNESMQ